MGLWSTIKGWFNIGGVKVELVDVEDPFTETDTVMKGAFKVTTSTDKTILSYSVRFYLESTTYDDEGEEQTETKTVGEMSSKDYMIQDEYPFELAAGEERRISFLMTDVDMRSFAEKLAGKGGVLGAAGKVAGFLGGGDDKKSIDEYYVEVTVDVKGTPFDPSDKRKITIIAGSS